MEAQIEDLDARLSKIKDLRNEVVIPTDKEIAVYVGEAIDLSFDGMDDDIRGTARLSKYERIKGTRNKTKLIQLFPPKFQTREVPFVKDRKIWMIDSWNSCNYSFLSHGKLRTGYDCSSDYRTALKVEATNHGLILSHKLFEIVFGPIDSKIMEMYKQKTRGFK